MSKDLTEMEHRFVLELVTWPQRGVRHALRAAGYRATPATAAKRLLGRQKVLEAIQMRFLVAGKPMLRLPYIGDAQARHDRDTAVRHAREERIRRRRSPARVAGAARAREALRLKRLAAIL